ncbi:protein ACCELERATED CELL DEATH 6-like protein [Cinnamomum micranthum f. kanehirae]|uniref:Protein ACCELERATED CELL DEATH 6-like protein n=1 Tax=Cinnamomum micranthum f. kanehirae TaxID=337451 RepID=A0A443PBT8_9MAGN|nr:protein ACCELERATED CELL DEATH 6-like protein [Cinnamomum micranthum f. kanehirae]
MDPRLYNAAMNGDMELLTSFIGVDCPPDLTLCLTPQKNTVLYIAVEFCRQNIVEKVIQLCPSLISQQNSKGDTPLHVAARAGHVDLTKLLTPALNLNLTEGNPALEEGNPVRQAGSMALGMSNLEGNNPFHEALKKSHGEVALHLLTFNERHRLTREVNMAGESLLYLAAEAGLDEVVKKIIEIGHYSTRGPDGQNPLHIAVIKGRLGVVEILLRDFIPEVILLDKENNFTADADCFGNTVLHYASAKSYSRVLKDKDNDRDKERWTEKHNQIQILELLLEANPSLAYVPNRNGDYPLFFAIRNDFGRAADTILDYCPDSAELVNEKGQNALHLAVMEKIYSTISNLVDRLEFKKLINEPDNDGNTPMHLATLTNDKRIVKLLIDEGSVDLTVSNKKGLTAMDICGYTKTKNLEPSLVAADGNSGSHPHPHHHSKNWQSAKNLKKNASQILPIDLSLVATVTFAAAFTVPGGYKNDGPVAGLPVFMRNAALHAFILSDTIAFCGSLTATILLVYGSAYSEDPFLMFSVLRTCYYISGVAILATITAFVTAVYVLTSKESLWLAVTSLLLGSAVPLFLGCT